MTKIAIVGLGIGAVYKEQALLRQYDVYTIDANPNIDSNYKTVEELADSNEFFDLIIVCTPNFLHERHFNILKNKSNKFIIEKPGVRDKKTLENIINGNPEKLITIAKNNLYRDWSWFYRLSDVKFVNILWLNKNRIPKPGSWFTNKELAWGGVSRDLMPHLLHMFYAITKQMPKALDTDCNKVWSLDKLNSSDYGGIDKTGAYDVDDHAFIKFKIPADPDHILATDPSIPIKLISSWKDVTAPKESRIQIETMSGIYYQINELGLCPNECYGKMIDDIINTAIEEKDKFNSIDLWVQEIIDNFAFSEKYPYYMMDFDENLTDKQ